jgi:hypothetical protein
MILGFFDLLVPVLFLLLIFLLLRSGLKVLLKHGGRKVTILTLEIISLSFTLLLLLH